MNENPFRNPADSLRCSFPRTSPFSFYNREISTMLFASEERMELFDQTGFRQANGLVRTFRRSRILFPIQSGTENKPGDDRIIPELPGPAIGSPAAASHKTAGQRIVSRDNPFVPLPGTARNGSFSFDRDTCRWLRIKPDAGPWNANR